jgi:hypothetical protein
MLFKKDKQQEATYKRLRYEDSASTKGLKENSNGSIQLAGKVRGSDRIGG